MSHRILAFDNQEIEFSGDVAINLSDTVFEFLDDEGQGSSPESISDNICDESEAEDDENNEKKDSVDDTDFWETQHQLLQVSSDSCLHVCQCLCSIGVNNLINFTLQATLCRTTSLETKIRNITKETLKEAKQAGNICGCQKPPVNGSGGCRSCLMKAVCSRLQNAGFNSAICKSKWKSTDIPSGIYFIHLHI